MKRWLAVLTVVAALGLATPSVLADHGRGQGKGNPHNRADHDRDHDRDAAWERRGEYEVRAFNPHEGYPPGWSRGKKTGWGNC